MTWKISVLAVTVSALLLAVPTRAAELTIFATGSMADPLKEVGEDFTHQTGHTLRFSLGTTGGVLNKLRAGEKGDVIVISDEAADALEKEGKIMPGSRKDVARALFAVVVKANAPTPDISTPEALKKAVLAARSISYPDPVTVTASGGYIQSVFQLLGIKDEANKKAAFKPMGALVGEAVAKACSQKDPPLPANSSPTRLQWYVPAALQKPQSIPWVFAGGCGSDWRARVSCLRDQPGCAGETQSGGRRTCRRRTLRRSSC
jgi:molybdate transport system substrate-binding protein